MFKRVKAMWLRRLRSGKYKQAVGKLKTKDGCCLGVLTDLYREKVGGVWKSNPNGSGEHCFYYDPKNDPSNREGGVLPAAVMEWAGLNKNNPQVFILATNGEKTQKELRTLSSVNDNGFGFKQIADLIEKNL